MAVDGMVQLDLGERMKLIHSAGSVRPAQLLSAALGCHVRTRARGSCILHFEYKTYLFNGSGLIKESE